VVAVSFPKTPKPLKRIIILIVSNNMPSFYDNTYHEVYRQPVYDREQDKKKY
jgi:hypothetical protein